MILMVAMGILTLLGVIAVVRWTGTDIVPPWDAENSTSDDDLGPWERWRRFVWYLGLVAGTSFASALLVVGPGGRLAMRLLAVTAGDGAQGRLTEADEIVGSITIDGTIAFVLFIGISGGLLSSMGYVLLQRWLPGGRWKGALFGGVLFVVAATRLEPLRVDNPDFDIVGPGRLAIVVFLALGLLQGAFVAAAAGRISRALPVIALRPGALIPYGPLVLLILPPLALFFVVGSVVSLVPTAAKKVMAWGESRQAGWIAQGVVALAVVASLPGFVSAVVDIAGRP